MRMILVYLPLVVFLVGFMLGQIRIGRVAMFFAAWLLAALGLILVGVNPFDPTKFAWTIGGIGMALVAIPAALVFGFATSKPITPVPIEVVAEASIAAAGKAKAAYDGLSPENQRRVQQAGRLGLKLSLRAFADYLSRKGHESAAKAARTSSKLV